jgi:hypothetical protein
MNEENRSSYRGERTARRSPGGVPGVSGNVDMNTLTDTDGEWLTEKSGFDFEWLTAGPEVK